jgi:acyl-CoA reductase-like NAD-dependent aldehyde dehydrogenase
MSIKIYDEFLSEFVGIVGSWKTGPASMEGIMLGSIQNEMQYEIVKNFFNDTRSKGYKFALEGGGQKRNRLCNPACHHR